MDYEKLADKLLEHGDKRSAVYREGMITCLKRRIEGIHLVVSYAEGTLEFDAYYAGSQRGYHEWRNARLENGNTLNGAIEYLKGLIKEAV